PCEQLPASFLTHVSESSCSSSPPLLLSGASQQHTTMAPFFFPSFLLCLSFLLFLPYQIRPTAHCHWPPSCSLISFPPLLFFLLSSVLLPPHILYLALLFLLSSSSPLSRYSH